MTKHKTLVVSAVAFASLSLHGIAMGSTVAQVEAQASGTAATLDNDPVITYIAAQPGTIDGITYLNYAFLVNDGTGSLDIFGALPSGSTYVPTVGDSISVSGTYVPFDNMPEIDLGSAISRVSAGNSIPGPTHVTIPQLLALGSNPNYGIQEYLLELDNVSFVPPFSVFPPVNGVLIVTDGTHDATLYCDRLTYSAGTALAGTSIPSGLVDITGIVRVEFNEIGDVVEFLPFSVTPVPEPTSLLLFLLGVVTIAITRLKW
jgi:hypothetical protein